ncbi:MAG: lycopene cyclase family protein [Saprospiraceae bacterium]
MTTISQAAIHTSKETLVDHYDYIVAGAGCAGLSLVWRMLKLGFTENILLVDRELKQKNDRTWSFWEAGAGDFENIVYKKWDYIDFHGTDFSQRFNISPYQYKTIRGIDFYEFVLPTILNAPNVHFLKADIKQFEVKGNQVLLTTSVGSFTSQYLFNSSIRQPIAVGYNNVIQHFKGWIIRTPNPIFDPAVATFMDFRIEQKDETRFVYVLPKNECEAMVEGTIFSNQLLSDAEYDQINADYIRDYLKIEEYEIIEEEGGQIPMTDFPFSRGRDGRIINIGTTGGLVKPSSGYAFLRIQEHTQAVVEALQKGNSPLLQSSWYEQRFRFYDSILLNVILNDRLTAKTVFTELFKNNDVDKIFNFLNEKNRNFSEVKLMWTLPKIPFTAALLAELRKAIRR